MRLLFRPRHLVQHGNGGAYDMVYGVDVGHTRIYDANVEECSIQFLSKEGIKSQFLSQLAGYVIALFLLNFTLGYLVVQEIPMASPR